MFNTEENKLDKFEHELSHIEKEAKNLDLNSKFADRMLLTDIVYSENKILSTTSDENIVTDLRQIKSTMIEQIQKIDKILKKIS